MDIQNFTTEKAIFPRRSCGVLGATGSVGQRFILLLANHPHFQLTVLGASKRSAGQSYRNAAQWKQAQPMSKELGDLIVQECVPEAFKDCDIIFSGLDSSVAGDVGRFEILITPSIADEPTETAFLEANLRVFSNAKNHRQDPDVPLVVPTVNLRHLDVLAHQKKVNKLDKGFLVCNSNCAVVALAVPFAALQERFGPIECSSVVTMQAVGQGSIYALENADLHT